jgi:hypothetical protein
MSIASIEFLQNSITSPHLSKEIRASLAVSLVTYFFSDKAFLSEFKHNDRDAYYKQYPELRQAYQNIDDVQVLASRCAILEFVEHMADEIYTVDDIDILASLIVMLTNGWAAQTDVGSRRHALRSVRPFSQRLALKLLTSFDPTINEMGEKFVHELFRAFTPEDQFGLLKALTSHVRAEAMHVGEERVPQQIDDIPF